MLCKRNIVFFKQQSVVTITHPMIGPAYSLSEKGSDPLWRGKKIREIDSPPKGQTPFRIGSYDLLMPPRRLE